MKKTIKILVKTILFLIGIFIVALVGLFITFFFIGKKEDKKSAKELLDNTYNSRFQKRGTSYVVVSVVGDKVDFYCYGYDKSKHPTIPTDSTTMFDIASLGKLFTSTTVKILDNDKKLISMSRLPPILKIMSIISVILMM